MKARDEIVRFITKRHKIFFFFFRPEKEPELYGCTRSG